METEQYRAFGLTIATRVALPVLADRQASAVGSDPDVVVDRGPVPAVSTVRSWGAELVYTEPETLSIYRSTDTLYWFDEAVGRLRISDGDEIVVDPTPEANHGAVQAFVLGPGLYSALVQRGQSALHASAVAIGNGAVAFAGETGRGKSTTAAACCDAGHELLADDVTAINVVDGEPLVQPGYPQLKIDEQAATTLGVPSIAGSATDGVDVADQFCSTAKPLRAIYFLTDSDGAVRSERVAPRKGLFKLMQVSYLLANTGNVALFADHQRACADLASRIEIRRLYRPRSLDQLASVVTTVETDLMERRCS